MNTRDKYNKMIGYIEELVELQFRSTEIVEMVAKEFGISTRDADTVMKYMTEMPLNTYVKRRKMNFVYNAILNMRELDVSHLVDLYVDCSDQAAFNKAFKRQFDVTPTEVFEKRDKSLLSQAIYWDVAADVINKPVRPYEKKKAILGIDANLYEKLSEIENLKAIFGFDYDECEKAWKFSVEESIDLRSAFDLLDQMEASYECFDNRSIEELMKENKKYYQFAEKYGLYLDDAITLWKMMEKSGIKPAYIPENIMRVWLEYDDIDFSVLKTAYEYYRDNKLSVPFDTFILQVGCHKSAIDSFESLDSFYEVCEEQCYPPEDIMEEIDVRCIEDLLDDYS